MEPFNIGNNEQDKKRKRVLLSTLCSINGIIVCAAIAIPLILITQCKNKNDGTKSIDVSIFGNLISGATIIVNLINGASWGDVTMKTGTDWTKSTAAEDYTFTKTNVSATADENVVVSLAGGNICSVTVPSGYKRPSTLVTTTTTYTIDTSIDFMTSRNNIGKFIFTDTNGDRHEINRDTIKEIHLIDLPPITGNVPNNYGRYLCLGFTNLTVADIQFPANFPTTVGSNFCSEMFVACTSLQSLPPSFTLPRGIIVAGDDFCADMFSYCETLQFLSSSIFNLPSIITTTGENFCSNMFYNCESLLSLPYGFNLPQGIATTGYNFCESMFNGCIALQSLPYGFNLPLGIVTTGNWFCYNMFNTCRALTSNDPAEDLKIPNPSPVPSDFCTDMFVNSGISGYDSPSPGSNIPIKRW